MSEIRVLVIDDSATIRKLVEMTMRGTSFQPHFSALGADGIAQAKRVQPAAILLDCVLPDMSGVQVCRQLAADEQTASIPILIVSAKAESVREELRDLPSVVELVPKPFTGPDLLRRIRRALAGSAPKRKFTREQHERAAKILYARLRDGLAVLPAHLQHIGSSPPSPFLAKRLLTPEAVAGILEDLFVIWKEVRDEPEPAIVEPLAPSVILDRAPGFSARITAEQVDATERRVLALVNGRSTLDDIARRLGASTRSLTPVLRDLVDRGLLVEQVAVARRPIVILEPDIEGFQQPLASLLETRAEAPALVPVATLDEIVPTARRLHPCLVVVNATDETTSVGAAARELRADARLADVALVAVVDRLRAADRDDLYSAGFDAVLGKPVIVGDLERFITPFYRKDDQWIRS